MLLLLFPLPAVVPPVAGPVAAAAPVMDVTALAEFKPAAAVELAQVDVAADEAVVAALPKDPGRGFLVDPAVAAGPPAEPNPVEAWRFFPAPGAFAAV